MDPDHQIARQVGLLPKLEELEYAERFYAVFAIILGVSAALLYAASVLFAANNFTKFSAIVAACAAVFSAIEQAIKRIIVPRLLSKARTLLADGSDDPRLDLVYKFLGAKKRDMLSEGFRSIPQRRTESSPDTTLEVMGRGYFKDGASSIAEEYAVLYRDNVIAISRVVAIDGDSIWQPGSDYAFEGGPDHGGVWGEVVRTMSGLHLSATPLPSLEVVCLGLQSSTESPEVDSTQSTSLSLSRAQKLVNTMANRSLSWSERPDVKVLGLNLGRARTVKPFGTEAERRQRSGIIVFLTRDLAYELVLPFATAIRSIVGVSTINGTILDDYEFASALSDRLVKPTFNNHTGVFGTRYLSPYAD